MKRNYMILFFIIYFLLCTLEVEAVDSGQLQLDTNIITNTNITSSNKSDFVIKHQLFSHDIMNRIDKIQLQQNSRIHYIKTIDFNKKTLFIRSEQWQHKQYLFKNYEPKVRMAASDETTIPVNWLIILSILGGISVFVIGSLLGRCWVNRKEKKYDRFDNNTKK